MKRVIIVVLTSMHKHTLNIIFIFLLGAFFAGCQTKEKQSASTTSNRLFTAKVKHVYEIPKELKEISGICFAGNNELVAVEDEKGVLYFYDFEKEAIVRKHHFAAEGDYEDVAVAGDSVFIVNSAGTIFQINQFKNSPKPAKKIKTALKEKNNIEGLAYDKTKNRLLLAVKDQSLRQIENKEVYSFSLATKQLDTIAAYSIKLAEVEAFFKGDEIEEASKKFLKALGNQKLNEVFRTSAVAFHPQTQELYVLTSLNNMIAVLSSKTGRIKKIILLKGPGYNQPEGLAFTPTGRLFVSNESNGKRANIIEIEYE